MQTTLQGRADFFADAYSRNSYDHLAAPRPTHTGSGELDLWLTIFWVKAEDGQWRVNQTTTYSSIIVGK